jgi:hypothetical protein
MHEVEHVARELAAEAVEELLLKVHRAARSLIVMEGAVDLDLLARANWREAIVRKY